MAQGSFTAQISEQVRKAKGAMLAVRNESVQRVIEIAQTPVGAGGNLPIDTGFLRASLQGSIGNGTPPLRDRPDDEARYSYDVGQIALVIAGAELQDTITVAYGASYARHVEYGARGRAGRRFVGLAAQQWPRVVDEVCREAQARMG